EPYEPESRHAMVRTWPAERVSQSRRRLLARLAGSASRAVQAGQKRLHRALNNPVKGELERVLNI
ncbi:MAG TPA: hypothetical protein VFJ84_00400, partial [Candidatus Saccharimonadales bacterium]|nr:hypothetical protein [Candidatus Saccharimonadales bacterium]